MVQTLIAPIGFVMYTSLSIDCFYQESQPGFTALAVVLPYSPPNVERA